MKIKFFAPLLISLFALSACGGGESSISTSETSATSQSQTSTSSQEVKYEVTFDQNYDGAAASTVVEVKAKDKVTKPTDPTRSGYTFAGWFTDEIAYSAYDFETLVKKSFVLYAGWDATGDAETNRYVFEAEYSPAIPNMQGATYSGGTYGGGLIGEDYKGDYGASNGYFVHFLYVKGADLTFDIVSDAAASACVYMRLSAEYSSFTIDDDMYQVKVNGVAIDYESISFTDVPTMGAGDYPFKDYLLNVSVPLTSGTNKIEMITNNETLLQGTATSTAPMIDCLKFKTSSNLTWPTESTSNIDLV